MLYTLFLVLAILSGYKLASLITRVFRFTDQIKTVQQKNVFHNAKEVPEPIWLPIHGAIPQWLSGIMYRIGPGKYNLDGNKFMIKHAFDGLPFMHRFELSAERQAVRYNARNLAGSLERQLVEQRAQSSMFFGHVQDLSMLDRCILLARRFLDIVILGIINRDDPSSTAVGVTATPNFPMPTQWLERSKKALGEYHLVSKTDLNVLQQVHANTLEPKRLYNYGDYDKRLNGDLSASHHQYDPITEESFNFTIKLGPIPKLTVFSISRSGHVTILAEITHRRLPGEIYDSKNNTRIRPSFIHAFMLTQNYIIIPEAPLYYNDADILLSGNAIGSYVWDENSPAYFHIINRHPNVGHVISIPVDSFFSFHHANAWDTVDDENGNPIITLDTCAFSNADIIYQLHSFGTFLRGPQNYHHTSSLSTPSQKQTQPMGMSFPPIRQPSFGNLRRYRLSWDRDLLTGTGSYTTIVQNIEFPRFSQHYALRKNRFLWGCQLLTPSTEDEAERYILVKVDLESGNLISYNKPRYSCSEPIFVPKNSITNTEKDRKEGVDEDEGAIVSLVNVIGKSGPKEDGSFLLVLDSRTMEEMARCDIGQYNISTFHGSYINADFHNVSIN